MAITRTAGFTLADLVAVYEHMLRGIDPHAGHDGMGMRRFTRLTNGFSKKVENLAHAVSLHYMHYNFARVH